MNKLAVFNWSGGKDSTLALHYILLANDYKVCYLLTTVNDAFNRIAMHGVRESLLIAQASSINIQLYQIRLPEMPDMETYEKVIDFHFKLLKEQGIGYTVFGDIFLEDLKKYREQQFDKIGVQTVFPLWKRDSLEVVKDFINLGYKTIVVCARADLKDFCGRVIDEDFLDDLPDGVDPCGENGEFHTFVFDGPIFKTPLKFTLGELVYKELNIGNSSTTDSGFWYIDLVSES